MKSAIIIGSGFSGLSSACVLAKHGWEVTVLEKLSSPGGRARQKVEKGFTFDMGPSWYWMPDVFERFFQLFDKKVTDYYELIRLNPSYKIYFEDNSFDIPSNYSDLRQLFEKIEQGSAEKLDEFINDASIKYNLAINNFVTKPGLSFTEFLDLKIIKGIFKLEIFTSIKNSIAKRFKDQKLRQILEFPVLFLGALPQNTPALYSLMNYADIKLGTWYPKGGMYKIVDALYQLAEELGVKFHFSHNVTEFKWNNSSISKVTAFSGDRTIDFSSDVVIASSDYHFVETHLLPGQFQSYSEKYWNSRKMAPSCLLYYVGVNKKLNNIKHHMLFFDKDFKKHATEIYTNPEWPENPLFYVSATSVTDDQVAPAGMENLFFLIPLAAGLDGDTEGKRTHYFNLILARFEEETGEEINKNIIYYKTFGPGDFVNEYNAFKGNAYGLANTLLQTANLKPSCKSKKVNNLFYTGQLTVPGPGVPPALISGEVVANEVIKWWNKKKVQL